MGIEEFKDIRKQISDGRDINERIKEKNEEIDRLTKSLHQMFNRCMVFTMGTMCDFCGFKKECKKG